MADLCSKCDLPSDVQLMALPCGHSACPTCIGEPAQDGGRRCPVCHKTCKVELESPPAASDSSGAEAVDSALQDAGVISTASPPTTASSEDAGEAATGGVAARSSPTPGSSQDNQEACHECAEGGISSGVIAPPPAEGVTPVANDESYDADANEAPCWVDALPDELLEQVLSLVPAGRHCEALLGLRLVCRRWAGLIAAGGRAVWHGGRDVVLAYNFDHQHRGYVRGVGALRFAPALRRVVAEVGAGENSISTKYTLQALEHSQAEVSRLLLDVTSTKSVDRFSSHALVALRGSLRELDLRLTCHAKCGTLTRIPEALQCLDHLTSLKISMELGDGRERPPLDWDLCKLTALRRLVVGNNLTTRTVHSLLEGSKASLQEVDFGPLRQIPSRVNACSALKTVCVQNPSAGLLASFERLLPSLEVLVIEVKAWLLLEDVADHLASSPAFPRVVRLSIHEFEPDLTLRSVLAQLDHRVRALELRGKLHMSLDDVAACLSHLTGLEELRLLEVHFTGMERGAAFVELAERHALPPALRVLHVHFSGKGRLAWVPALQALRPGLRVCNAFARRPCIDGDA